MLPTGLLALIWTSTAIATPLIAEPLLPRANSSTCPPGYTTRNGLRFTTYCHKNSPSNEIIPYMIGIPSMEDCMELCSRLRNDGDNCYGVVWRVDNYCWLRSKAANVSSLTDETKGFPDIHTAFIDPNDMKAQSNDCPGADLSQQTLSLQGEGSIVYTVQCDKVIDQNDYCWRGTGTCNVPFVNFYHATSLEECLRFCTKEHPLCRAVSYDPDMTLGYANCLLKTASDTLRAPNADEGSTVHSAVISSFEPVNTTCPFKTYNSTSTSPKQFAITCGQDNSGANLTQIHTQNITACMDTCATIDSGCVGVVFDSSLQEGFQNCYLKNTTNTGSSLAVATYAAVIVPGAPSSSSSLKSDDKGSATRGGSKAWIAGAVIGGIAGLAIIGAAIWFIQKRKAASPRYMVAGSDQRELESVKFPMTGSQLPEMDGTHVPEMGGGSILEMGGGQVLEMDGRAISSTQRYPHQGGLDASPAVEGKMARVEDRSWPVD